jgi:UDP-glucose 4-epimerase
MIALVTGGCGFIGSQIVRELQDIASEIRIIDDMSLGKYENVSGLKYVLHVGCITNNDLVSHVMKDVSHVFHCAALISVADSVNFIQDYEYINTIGTVNILLAAQNANVSTFVFSSSCSVYGEDPVVLRNENSSLNPVSPYAMTKVHSENYCKYINDNVNSNMNIAVLRYFNVYGAKQDPAKNYAAAVPIFIKKGIAHKPITIYGDGQQSRDFVHVFDIARANVHAAVNNLDGIYNIGSGVSTSIIDLAKSILTLTGNASDFINFEEARAGDMRFIECDNTKIIESGFKFNYPTLSSGLLQMIHELTK